jgi:hypothetical protein
MTVDTSAALGDHEAKDHAAVRSFNRIFCEDKKTVEPIFLAGTFLPDSLETSFLKAFRAIGVKTAMLDVGDARCRFNALIRSRVGYRLTMRSLLARSVASSRFNRVLEQAVLDAGARTLVVIKGEFVMPETLRRLRQRGVRVALFYPDNPFPPHASQRPETLLAARETDLYLIWSERLVDKLRAAGIGNPAYLPFAWDPEVFPYCESQPQGTWPGVLFLGGWDKERAEFLEELAAHVPLRIFGPPAWGSRTKTSSRVRQCFQGRVLRTVEAARVIRESAVCVNLMRAQHTIDGVPDGTIMRHFEVPGAGGVLLSTRGTGATALFPEGETGEYFADVAECVAKTRKFIADAAARRQFCERAHAAVVLEHQYTDRARQILRLLEECR